MQYIPLEKNLFKSRISRGPKKNLRNGEQNKPGSAYAGNLVRAQKYKDQTKYQKY